MTADVPSPTVTALSRVFGESVQVAILTALVEHHELTTRQLVEQTGYESDVLQIAVDGLERERVLRRRETANGTAAWRLRTDEALVQSLADLIVTASLRAFYR